MLVALLAEGVDRNRRSFFFASTASCRSPSSRRAWIEIPRLRGSGCSSRVALLAEGVDRNHTKVFHDRRRQVALLAEGVDRNTLLLLGLVALYWSPSSRRAWIEMFVGQCDFEIAFVALLAEGVDRNSFLQFLTMSMPMSPSSRRAWIEIKTS